MSLQDKLEGGDNPNQKSFSMEDLNEEWEQSIKDVSSDLMMGIYGEEGTAKSGILLNARTEEEKKQGVKHVIIDADQSCRPLWKNYWNKDPNIRIIDPLVSMTEGKKQSVDYVATYEKLNAWMGWIEQNIEKQNIGYVSIDGLDTFLNWCQLVMKIVDMKNIDVHNSEVGYDWGKRNRRYYDVFKWLKSLPVHSMVTAHLETQTNFEKGTTEVTGPNWHRGTRQETDDDLFQKVRTRKVTKTEGSFKIVRYFADIEKWKGNIEMEGKRILVLENEVNLDDNSAEYQWYGFLPKVRQYQRESNKKRIKKEKQEKEPESKIDEIKDMDEPKQPEPNPNNIADDIGINSDDSDDNQDEEKEEIEKDDDFFG